ncbi:uncharacterized protein EI90DRAFT_3064556 [Cantharellus anzutake]|uniref:uncharacterized protein n=1 Tax=Cantharellus anzutake TaxID=1750568 RepID=UPI001905EB6B|nr:uncharacterized protein EI90DRAFT_3064556 [Cantharellus anzutake]KAF8328551.1 hypothetical protein EI90DRAFT_3064556 [Cantharellus anzutake]
MHFAHSALSLCFSVIAISRSVLGSASATVPKTLSPRTSLSIDVCAEVDVNLATSLLGLLGIRLPAHICLCLGTIPAALVSTRFSVNKSPNKHTCQFPPHSQRVCRKEDPCGYECIDGYSKASDGHCYCPSDKYECNGRCQTAACPNPSAHSRRRAVQLALARCPTGYEKCGVYGRGRNTRGYECIDTRVNLESCGGCTSSLPGLTPTGRDCSAIANASSVRCVSSKCVIEFCRPGYLLDISGSECIHASLDS